MHILGLSALAHDSSAALVNEHGVASAMEEGKLTRSRAASGIPHTAIRFCLGSSGISWAELERVAVASKFNSSWWRRSRQRYAETIPTPVSSGHYLRILRQLAGAPADRVMEIDHHLCHAASCFYPSPFERALILTFDEMGDGQAGVLAWGEGNSIRPLQEFAFPNSVGWVYSQVTELLGFRPRQDEHKTQWLSLSGEPDHAKLFLKIMRSPRGPAPHLNRKFFNRGLEGRIAFSGEFYRRIGLSGPGAEISDQLRANLAASLQLACASLIRDFLSRVRRERKAKSICLAGGVFLNPLLVDTVERECGFANVFVQVAAGNEGTALGAAWHVRHQILGLPRQPEQNAPYWGPHFSSEEIKQVLDNCKATYHWLGSESRKLQVAVNLLQDGAILAWFQGAAEFGPRALGNRSLLASPWAPYIRENLNNFVKHRESFRPFALSVPEEDCARYFDCSPLGEFMATIGRIRAEAMDLLGSHALPGGFVRVHIVRREANLLLWQLLHKFGESSPAPILVNTSFNLFGEPLVITPRDAIRSFYCSGTDALMLGDFLLTKSTAQGLAEEDTSGAAERWPMV